MFSQLTAFLPDAAGNEYDLSDLSKEGEPWVAIDTSKEAKKRTFFLNVCKPLPYVTGCPGKPSCKHFFARPYSQNDVPRYFNRIY